MDSKEIRERFLTFFKNKGHEVVTSAPVVIKNDPTLMFTNAGMNQFKDVFLGNKELDFNRAADTQKCMRVSGKHNDLEDVGVDTYHHTLFEMLGNWSFGDYFKKEAIEWAWELLTEVYKIEKDRLYVTIFEGDQEDRTKRDDEAFEIWKNLIDETRIIEAGKKDNFWEMGDVGPSGPCSEIHVDLRLDNERRKIPGKKLVNKDHPQVIEVWNLVFIEYNRLANRDLIPLPKRHVDTGMGLERLAMVLQKKQSNYDTDLFVPLIKKVENISGKKYQGTDSREDIAFRVIADHIRAITFTIADGQLPSNTGAGYVVRRILRRAVRYGFSYLDIKVTFLNELLPVLDELMGDYFHEIRDQKELIAKVLKEEEESFLRTLDKGLLRINQVLEGEKKNAVISGEMVFELYDTFGFPPDLTSLILRENEMSYDEGAFAKKLNEQKQRSKKDAESDKDDWVVVNDGVDYEFVGYDCLEVETKILRYRRVKAKKKELFHLVLEKSPFYAESGGQVGDIGTLENENDKIHILDTKKENDLSIHVVNKLPSNLDKTFLAKVNVYNRKAIEKNHTATHLLHHALRQVLGDHVQQKGSLVSGEYLRFDFSHFSKLTDEELLKVESLVNQKIVDDIDLVEERNIPIEKAKGMGAMALFGEKYGDNVRVIKFNDSIELCGGTHVSSTSKIGLFKITVETAIAAGIRRIEARSSVAAINFLNKEHQTLEEVKELVKNPKDVVQTVKGILDTNLRLEKRIDSFKKQQVKEISKKLVNSVQDINGVNFVSEELGIEADQLKDLAFGLKGKIPNLFAILGSSLDGKASLALLISENLVEEKGLNAGKIIKEIAREIKGGGGGQPFFATAGGKHTEGIKIALGRAEGYLK